MSTRRHRVKAAAILKPRRPNATGNETSDNITTIKPECDSNESEVPALNSNLKNPDSEISTSVNKKPEIDVKPSFTPNEVNYKKSLNKLNQQNNAPCDSMENRPPDVGVIKTSTPNASVTPFRRISTPPVNIVNRRKSLIASDVRSAYGSPKYIKSPAYSFVRDLQTKEIKPNGSPHHSLSSKQVISSADDEIASPAPPDNDECFKSPPFMSPIYTRRIDPSSMSPFHDIYGDDCTKSPSTLPNATKIRQRIRPTPCFASRRNSIQGSGGFGAETDDDQHRRQRHYSTSSNHSSYNPASTPQRNYFGLNKVPSRVRTESYSSSISDIPFSKTKRSHRSEEYQRVANAKREFSQRLNGKPPDKSRLTMYDLIYYNPMTNPMSKPAGGKGDKNSDTASMASVKTNHSRSSGSVKSEASTEPVKSEKSENTETVTGPVPQLKLDANGEIILDEKSLVIETTGNKEAREMLANSDVVYDDEFSGTSGFYKRQKRTRDWLPLETLKFYRSLQTIGTDFSVMLQLFPNRSRRDLKLKFKKEEKHNMALINKALLHPKEFNVDELKLQFDKEDEEIEQKKQEWAEVRRKMANERRVQLSASRKRNPSKQISRSMRSLTDGDMVYENEFVTLPPKTRKNRKRKVITETLENSPKIPSVESILSPFSLGHNNNNHFDALPQHTYATHKLPSFTEMISSQKSRQSSQSTESDPNSDIPIDFSTNANKSQSSNLHEIDQSIGQAIDLSTTSESRRRVVKGNKSIENTSITKDDSPIGQYIAENPNLTFKGTGDIMNMDIIFENVSIEEDVTIGSNVTIQESTTETVECDIQTIDESPIVTTISKSQIEQVQIDDIQYEIVTLENTNENPKELCVQDGNDTTKDSFVHTEEEAAKNILVSTSTRLGEDNAMEQNYLDQNQELVVVVMSDSNLNTSVSKDETVEEPKVAETNNTDVQSQNHTSNVTDQNPSGRPNVIQSTQNNGNERKRRKVVPLLTNNKRPKRGTVNKMNDVAEPKTADIPSMDQPTKPEREESQPEIVNTQSETLKTEPEAVKTEKLRSEPENLVTFDKETAAVHHGDNDNDQIPEQTIGATNEIDQTMDESRADSDSDNDNDNDVHSGSFMDSLVVVESQDPNGVTVHEVYVVDPETNEMSDKPLDLPDHVIQRIRLSMQ